MVIIAVTGVPGTGKTTLSKEICKRYGFEYLDVMSVVQGFGLALGYDDERDTVDVDVNGLKEVLKGICSQGDYVLDSHLSHDFEFVDWCVVCSCSQEELNKRLKERGYNDLKIKENLEAQAFDVCLIEAQENRLKVIDANREDFFEVLDYLLK